MKRFSLFSKQRPLRGKIWLIRVFLFIFFLPILPASINYLTTNTLIFAPPLLFANSKKIVLDGLIKEKLQLSSSFGEFRKDHLHLGIDLRMRGRTGIPLHNLQNSYFFSLGYAPSSYGLFLTMQNADGTFIRLAHLQDIAEKIWQQEGITSYRKKFLYNEQFYFEKSKDALEQKNRSLYQKDEIIAFSGETGTGAPHIHFELHNAKQQAINPLIFTKHTIIDRQPPIFTRLLIEPYDYTTKINDKNETLEIVPIRKSINRYLINKTITVQGKIRLNLAGFDNANTDNTLGFYRLHLYHQSNQGKKVLYEIRFNDIYPKKQHRMGMVYDVENSSFKGIGYVYRLFNEFPGSFTWQKGLPFLSIPLLNIKKSSSLERFSIEAYDAENNHSELHFSIQFNERYGGDPPQVFNVKPTQSANPSRNPITIQGPRENLKAIFPSDSLLAPTKIQWKIRSQVKQLPKGMKFLSPGYELSPKNQYLEKEITVQLPIPVTAKNLQKKNYSVYRLHEQDHRIQLIKNISSRELRQGYVSFNTIQQGLFLFLQDETAPQWIGAHFNPQTIYRISEFIPGIYLRDTGSGINPSSIEFFLNNRPVKAHYNPNRQWIRFDMPNNNDMIGLHRISVKISDNAGNVSNEFRTSFRIGSEKSDHHLLFSGVSKANRIYLSNEIKLDQDIRLDSSDRLFTIIFPANSLASLQKAKGIFIQSIPISKLPANLRWNIKSSHVYTVHIPKQLLRKKYIAILRYDRDSSKSGAVNFLKNKIIYPEQKYSVEDQGFRIESFDSANYSVFFDSSAPEWGQTLFKENKIYEVHNVPIGAYIFDFGFGVNPQTIYIEIDNEKADFTYNPQNGLIKIKPSPKNLTKGFHRMTITVEDYAGNKSPRLDKTYIIRYKPKWGTER